MSKKFFIVTSNEQYATFNRLLVHSIFPIMSRKETLSNGKLLITVMANDPAIEKRLETEIFGSNGLMARNGFEASVSEVQTEMRFIILVPEKCHEEFLDMWRATGPGSKKGPWSCVDMKHRGKKRGHQTYEIYVHNEFAGDAIKSLFTGMLADLAILHDIQHKEVRAA